MAKRRHKNKRKKPVAVVRMGELATQERSRQQGGLMTEVVDREVGGKAYIKRQRARLECMLDYYHEQDRLSDLQYMAGMKYREIYLSANYRQNIKVLCGPFLIDGGSGHIEGKMIAHIDNLRHLKEADALLTPEQIEIVRDVCGYDKFAGGRDRKRKLLKALDVLADHWRAYFETA